MHLIIDTETTGLFDFKQPADAPGQPRIASIAMLLCNSAGRILDVRHQLVRPDGWEMPPEAGAVNGLSTDMLAEHGQPLSLALDWYSTCVARGVEVVAHNVVYDTKMLRGELRRARRPDLFEQTRIFCTMKSAQGPCGLGKWPKLAEALRILCGEQLPDAHDAIIDAMACRRIWLALRERAAREATQEPAEPAPPPAPRQAPPVRQVSAPVDDWGI